MNTKLHHTLFLSIALVALFLNSCSPLKKYSEKERKWAYSEIEAFERLNNTQTYADDAVLFIGSSSIRLWKTLETDMKPYTVIQRGYGGAHFRDMVFFTDRILANHPLSMVVCFVANDISGSPNDGTPIEVLKLFKYFVDQVRAKHPKIPIMQIAITPTKSRWKVWPEIKEVNRLIKAYCEKTENLYFIDTVPEFLDENGEPKPECFVEDQLHLNAKGYEVWNGIIKGEIEKVKS